MEIFRSQNVVQPVAANGSSDTLIVSNERFAPKFFNNQTTRSIASFFRHNREESTNNSHEIRPNIVQAGIDLTQNVLNVLSENKSQSNQLVGQNESHVVHPNPIESAQAAPRLGRGASNDSNQQQNTSLNKPIVDDLDDDQPEEDQPENPAAKAPLAIEEENRFGQVDRQRIRPKIGENDRLDQRQHPGRPRKGFRRSRLSNNEENQQREGAQQQHVL